MRAITNSEMQKFMQLCRGANTQQLLMMKDYLEKELQLSIESDKVE